MNKLQELTRDLRERINGRNRKLLLLAAPDLAGALSCLDLLLLELEILADRVVTLEANNDELMRLVRTAEVVATARDLDRDGGVTP